MKTLLHSALLLSCFAGSLHAMYEDHSGDAVGDRGLWWDRGNGLNDSSPSPIQKLLIQCVQNRMALDRLDRRVQQLEIELASSFKDRILDPLLKFAMSPDERFIEGLEKKRAREAEIMKVTKPIANELEHICVSSLMKECEVLGDNHAACYTGDTAACRRLIDGLRTANEKKCAAALKHQ